MAQKRTDPVRLVLFNGSGHQIPLTNVAVSDLTPEKMSAPDVFVSKVLPGTRTDFGTGTGRTYWLLVDRRPAPQVYTIQWAFGEQRLHWTPLLPNSKRVFDHARNWHRLVAELPRGVRMHVRETLTVRVGLPRQIPVYRTFHMDARYMCAALVGYTLKGHGSLAVQTVMRIAGRLADREISNYELVHRAGMVCRLYAENREEAMGLTLELVLKLAAATTRGERAPLEKLVRLWYRRVRK